MKREILVGKLPYRKLPCMYVEDEKQGIRILARFVDRDAMDEFMVRVGAKKAVPLGGTDNVLD